jgi:tRNA(Ile2) C34 agmatinyltransferase TiaS
MTVNKCSVCGGRMCWYGYDGLVCIKCGFVAQDTIISGRLPVV